MSCIVLSRVISRWAPLALSIIGGLCLSVFLTNAHAWETPWRDIPHGKVRFISTNSPIAAEKEFWLGLEVKLDEHWHTYWHNPGESGAGPAFDLSSQQALAIGEIQYLPPERIPGPLITFGYEGTVRFWRKLQASTLTDRLEIKLDVELLVCEKICVPAILQESIRLPISNQAQSTVHQNTWQADAKKFPQQRDDVVAEAQEKGDKVQLQLTLPAGWQFIDFFPYRESGLAATTPQLIAANLWLFDAGLVEREQNPRILLLGKNTDGATEAIEASVTYAEESVLLYLLMAFLGGMILNLMPCVFPVISIKLLGFLKKAELSTAAMRASVAAYVAGILVSFWLLAILIISLKASGEAVGWGFQLQSPLVVASLAILFFVLSLSFLDFFSFSLPFFSQGISRQTGLLADFSSGFLTTIIASPCTAPFMGAAIGYAFTQNVLTTLLLFTGLGLGLAAPYLLFVVYPPLRTFLPRPGKWMETLKQFMAFPLLATSVWLLYLLTFLSGAFGVAVVLLVFLGIAFLIWLHRQWQKQSHARVLVLLVLLAGFLVTAYIFLPEASEVSAPQGESVGWEVFSPSSREAFLAEGKAVFIDFTATWCVTCQVNKKLVLQKEAIIQAAKKQNIVLMRADWTKRDAVITQELERFGRVGVPFYVLYFPEKKRAPLPLPEVLTESIVLDAFSQVKSAAEE